MIMEELLSTEREYVNALGYVREHYFPELERADVPQDLRGQRGSIFGNLEKLHDFHRHHFLNKLETCVNEPFRVGCCFLQHVGAMCGTVTELEMNNTNFLRKNPNSETDCFFNKEILNCH